MEYGSRLEHVAHTGVSNDDCDYNVTRNINICADEMQCELMFEPAQLPRSSHVEHAVQGREKSRVFSGFGF